MGTSVHIGLAYIPQYAVYIHSQKVVSELVTLYLHVSLWLHESAHHSEVCIQLSRVCVCCHARYDGVVGPLAWGQGVRMDRVKGKVAATILCEYRFLL